MDLTPLYDLRERLKNGAIAGTELVGEDFRLKRAVEAFAPLEQASPVFGKIGQLSRTLIAQDCPDRAGALLDAASLADAVLCTQGLTEVEGEIEPLLTGSWGAAVNNAPYSVLSSLLNALANSGGGRYSIVMEAHKNNPGLFKDYRVKAALVKALGASYVELADQAAVWLTEEGPSIVPLLKKDFDPKGKKEMARRVKLIDALAGPKENSFYLSQLNRAERDVKLALIYALRHSEENAGTLLELAKAEKGNARNMARFALAFLDGVEVWDYWRSLALKNPRDAARYMAVSTAEDAGRLVGEALIKQLESLEKGESREPLGQEEAETIAQLLAALPGKYGPAICECYRRAAALGTFLDRPAQGIKGTWVNGFVLPSGRYTEGKFSKTLPAILHKALLVRPTPDLEELAGELYNAYGKDYLPAALAARLLRGDAGAVYEWVKSLLEKKTLLGQTKQIQDAADQVEDGLGAVYWDDNRKAFVLRTSLESPGDGGRIDCVQPLPEPLEPDFYELLMRRGKRHMDGVLAQWIQPGNRPLCEKLGQYFYDRALAKKECAPYLRYLRDCGWEECAGLAVHYCKTNTGIYSWRLFQFIEDMPGSVEARAAEALSVCNELENGRIKVNVAPAALKNFILDMQNSGPICL